MAKLLVVDDEPRTAELTAELGAEVLRSRTLPPVLPL